MLTRDIKNPFFFASSIAPGTELSGSTPAAGDWVDCQDIAGPVAGVISLAASTGSPTAIAHAFKIREADSSGGSGAADIVGATLTVDEDDQTVVLQANNRSKRYVQVYVTPAFTEGTTPKTKISAAVFGQKARY